MATERISPLDKTSLRIDRKKMAEAQKLLGTSTIADTVDAALDEVIGLGHGGESGAHPQGRRPRAWPGGVASAAGHRDVVQYLATQARGTAWSRRRQVVGAGRGDAIAICTPVRLELLYSARGATDHGTLDADLEVSATSPSMRVSSSPRCAPAVLAAEGHHRGPKPWTSDRRRGRGARRHAPALRPPLRSDRLGDGPEDRVARAARKPRVTTRGAHVRASADTP